MAGRGSIARLMVAVALVGVVLAGIRSWPTPAAYLGELAPMAILAWSGLAIAVGGSGGVSRFGGGMAQIAILESLVCLVAPTPIRHAVHDWFVAPIGQRLYGTADIPLPGGTPAEMVMTVWADRWGERHYWSGLVRCPFFRPESDLALGILQLPLALLGGAVAACGGPAPDLRGRAIGVPPSDVSASS